MVTGGGAMHLNDALGHKDGMHCLYNHHEQACAMAAEAYASGLATQRQPDNLRQYIQELMYQPEYQSYV